MIAMANSVIYISHHLENSLKKEKYTGIIC